MARLAGDDLQHAILDELKKISARLDGLDERVSSIGGAVLDELPFNESESSDPILSENLEPEGEEEEQEVIDIEQKSATCDKLVQIPSDHRLDVNIQLKMLNWSDPHRAPALFKPLHQKAGCDIEQCVITDWFDGGEKVMHIGTKMNGAQLPFIYPEFRGPSSSLNAVVAPWRRLITVHASKLGKVLLAHMRCSSLKGASSDMANPIIFHLSFYDSSFADEIGVSESWDVGMQYSRPPEPIQKNSKTASQSSKELKCRTSKPQYPRKFRESAVTIYGTSAPALSNESSVYWTILQLLPGRPNSFKVGGNVIQAYDFSQPRGMIDEMSRIIADVVEVVQSRWIEWADYFEYLIDEKDAVLNPSHHDSLLCDDAAFSKSKTYFWAVDLLNQLVSNMSDNIMEVQNFVSRIDRSYNDNSRGDERPELVKANCKRLFKFIERLKLIRARLKRKRKEIMVLREGLYNASCVIEAKASTQLGETVKLLTYVSIFFLPLSLCASTWSINNMFPVWAFWLGTPLLSIFTYIAVFNLHSWVQAIHNWCAPRLASHVSNMASDDSAEWRHRGQLFEMFAAPKPIVRRPSGWRVIEHQFRRWFVKGANTAAKENQGRGNKLDLEDGSNRAGWSRTESTSQR